LLAVFAGAFEGSEGNGGLPGSFAGGHAGCDVLGDLVFEVELEFLVDLVTGVFGLEEAEAG